MTFTRQMLEATSHQSPFELAQLASAIDACFSCATACTLCADACLGDERASDQFAHVRRNLACADICLATGQVLCKQMEQDAEAVQLLLQACVTSCRSCAQDCDQRHELASCQVCVQACRACEQTCSELLLATSLLPA